MGRKIKVEIRYNPYKMETKMKINDIDVCENNNYHKISGFIKKSIPLQNWIEPIPYRKWGGIIEEIANPEDNGDLEISFYGRRIDFEDLKRACNFQNGEREERTRLNIKYILKGELDDMQHSKTIDAVVKEIQSDRFKKLLEDRSGYIKEKYKVLEENYQRVKNNDFKIVFSGLYSSGKSTIINALIGHYVLPKSDNTCTQKNCYIRHDAKLSKEEISFACFDGKGKEVIKKQIFKNDDDCRNLFEKIIPTKNDNMETITEEYKNVDRIELGINLSHLYPENKREEFQKRFNIVIIDTPGTNSAQTKNSDGTNEHAKIALDAIADSSKPMVIVCAEGTKDQDDSIGRFLKEISDKLEEDNGCFKDRFLFILNKCDIKGYNDDERIDDAISAYAKYITDGSKWGLDNEKAKIADFKPTIFTTAALPAMAISIGAYLYTNDEINCSQAKAEIFDRYDDFRKRIIERGNENFYLSEHCDIPEYRKKELKIKFNKAKEKFVETESKEDQAKAVELQCGIEAVKIAIRDYIERYAYPIKVQALTKTFESILQDVTELSKWYEKELENKIEKLGKSQGMRGEVENEKRKKEKKQKDFEDFDKKIKEELEKLKGIEFDESELRGVRNSFELKIINNETIKNIRDNPTISIPKDADVKKIIDNKLKDINTIFEQGLRDVDDEFQRIVSKHKNQLSEIIKIIRAIADESVYIDFYGYNFENSSIWQDTFKHINVDKVREAVISTIKEGENVSVYGRNPEKDIKYHWWQFMKKYKQKKEPDNILIRQYWKEGSYSLNELITKVDDARNDFYIMIEKTKQHYTDDIRRMEKGANHLIDLLLQSINQYKKDISQKKQTINKLGNDISHLESERSKCNENIKWLKSLQKQIQGVGIYE